MGLHAVSVRWELDTERLARFVAYKRGSESLRYVARISGVSHTAVTRAENGVECDLDTLLVLCDWLEEDPRTFLRPCRQPSTGGTE